LANTFYYEIAITPIWTSRRPDWVRPASFQAALTDKNLALQAAPNKINYRIDRIEPAIFFNICKFPYMLIPAMQDKGSFYYICQKAEMSKMSKTAS